MPLVHTVQYNDARDGLRRQIASLLGVVYSGEPSVEPPLLDHDLSLAATSFYVLDGERVVSYAAVVHLAIRHGGEDWALAGLSAVATAPDFRGRGLATAVVAAATEHIVHGSADVGLFTCDPPLARLYERAGWPIAADLRVIGSLDAAALTSDALGKVVFMWLVSERARTAANRLLAGTIDLGLSVGQFL